MNRRKFLKIAGISLADCALGSNCYLNDEKMKRPRKIKGKILADLHSHLSKNNDIGDILNTLNWGITGLTIWHSNKGIISYEDAVQYPGVKEIDLGLLAGIEHGGSKGYFMKTQEINANYHILAIGCHKYLEAYNNPALKDARKVVEVIHALGGLAIVNHPFVVNSGNKLVPYRLINDAEERKLRELVEMVDEIEVFNAQSINPLLGIIVPNMKKANERAKELVLRTDFKGIAASDAHRLLEQSKISGIHIPEDDLCMEAIKHHIKAGNFIRHEQYVSRWSFLKGMKFSR